jgi:hypothetical protein
MRRLWIAAALLVSALGACGGGDGDGDGDDNASPVPPSGGPVVPIPAGVWHAPSAPTPSSGSYVYLESEVGEYIATGQTLTYVPASAIRDPVDAIFTVDAIGRRFGIEVVGTQQWQGDFEAMSSVASLQSGYYGSVELYPSQAPTVGGLRWTGNGRGCAAITGWFVVDSVAYDAGVLDSIELRFEQRCDGAAPALRGKVRWLRP